ncbi:MAG: energy transducer TonB [Calditrichaceae bacterium]|jgi:TonB family protein
MNDRTKIIPKLHLWTQERSPVKRTVGLIWKKLVLEPQYRLSGCISISILIHLFLFLSYMGMGALDKSTEPPIEEITFIDMNEIEEEPEEVIVKKEQPPIMQNDIIPPPPEEETEPSYAQQEQTTPKISLGNERLFLDTERKQAPIKIQDYEPVAGNMNQPKNVLSVSSAIGIKKDKRTSKSAALDLGKQSDMLMPQSVGPSEAVSIGPSGKSQIDLKPRKSNISANPVSNNITQSKPKPIKTEPDIKPKKTQTTITGDLANRKILEKEIPQFPYWAVSKGVGATISLRFTVMENGLVKETVIVERTSGSLQWDQMVISALKKWKFEPLKSSGLRQDQSGVITFQFVI